MPISYLKELQEDLKGLERQDQLEIIIELAQELIPLKETEKTKDNLIPGCLSQIHIKVIKEKDIFKIKGDADSLIVKGYLTILIKTLSNESKEVIKDSKKDLKEFLKVTKLSKSNIPTRTEVLWNIYEEILKNIK